MQRRQLRNVPDTYILAALPAFEAVARLGSITRAARELSLTQSGLSRRISTLEADLGVALFTRRGRSLAITGDGLRLSKAAGETLRLVEQMRHSLGGSIAGSIRVGVLPSIGSIWLAPRLAAFAVAQPSISINVTTIDADFSNAPKDPVNWDPSSIDIAITWGRGNWRSLVVHPLIEERMLPVCSPGLAEQYSVSSMFGLWNAPRLGHTTRADAWSAYAAGMHAKIPALVTPIRVEFEHFFLMLEAARAGAGVALLPEVIAADDLEAGRLVAPLPAWSTGSMYAAVSSASALSRPAVSAFVEWLASQSSC